MHNFARVSRWSLKGLSDNDLPKWGTRHLFVRHAVRLLNEEKACISTHQYISRIYGYQINPHRFCVCHNPLLLRRFCQAWGSFALWWASFYPSFRVAGRRYAWKLMVLTGSLLSLIEMSAAAVWDIIRYNSLKHPMGSATRAFSDLRLI